LTQLLLSFYSVFALSLHPKTIKQKSMELPKDSMMLFSFINTKLRDEYSSLDELCDDLNTNKEDLERKLKAAGFEYNPKQNKFW
jgi:hypothetical protein